MTKKEKEAALKALDFIAGIQISHVEQECDEGIDGEWEYSEHEVDDGTVGEAFPDEIRLIRKALEAAKEEN